MILHAGYMSDRSSSVTATSSVAVLDADDLVKIFGLAQRELVRSSRAVNVNDLTARQLAVAMAQSCKLVTAADLKEVGADAAPGSQASEHM